MIKIFEIIFGIVCLLILGVPFGYLYIVKKRTSKIPTMSTEELREMVTKLPLSYCNSIVKELLSRNEDISFVMPLYLKMACDKNPLNRLIGWQGLKTYFSERLPEIDFSEVRPSKNTLDRLRLIESELYSSSGT